MIAALRPCTYPRCPALVVSGRCAQHVTQERKRVYVRRGSATKQGYGYRWTQYRLSFLRANPLCVRCGVAAVVVDHITPHKGDVALFWDRANHQSLCKRDHDIKTSTEDGGFGNAIKG